MAKAVRLANSKLAQIRNSFQCLETLLSGFGQAPLGIYHSVEPKLSSVESKLTNYIKIKRQRKNKEKNAMKKKGGKTKKKMGGNQKKGRKFKNKKGSTISRVQKSRFLFKNLGNHTSIDRF